MNAIKTIGLTKKFKERTAVDDLNLTVQKGELFALLGQNGAGKTTTIRMLCGLLTPTEGDAEICGKSVIKEPLAAKQLTNVSPQETAVAAKLSVQENLELIARLYGDDKKTAREKAERMMESFRLTERRKDRAKTLSGGWQRRLSIAMALITEPEVLFLDEPTLGLDVRARRDLWKHIEELKGKVTVVLTTHYLEEAAALSDRLMIMDKGRCQADGTLAEILEKTGKASLEEAFLSLTEEVYK